MNGTPGFVEWYAVRGVSARAKWCLNEYLFWWSSSGSGSETISLEIISNAILTLSTQ